jgi:hypothetical protein
MQTYKELISSRNCCKQNGIYKLLEFYSLEIVLRKSLHTVKQNLAFFLYDGTTASFSKTIFSSASPRVVHLLACLLQNERD